MSTPPVVRVVDVYPYRWDDDGTVRFLLLRRAPGQMYAGTWRMVGGKIEAGETAWQAAQRELVEETRCGVVQLWTVPSVNVFYEWQHDRVNVVPAFAAEVVGEPTLNHEHDTSGWFAEDEALAHLSWPEHARLVRLIAKLLQEGIPPSLVVSPATSA